MLSFPSIEKEDFKYLHSYEFKCLCPWGFMPSSCSKDAERYSIKRIGFLLHQKNVQRMHNFVIINTDLRSYHNTCLRCHNSSAKWQGPQLPTKLLSHQDNKDWALEIPLKWQNAALITNARSYLMDGLNITVKFHLASEKLKQLLLRSVFKTKTSSMKYSVV